MKGSVSLFFSVIFHAGIDHIKRTVEPIKVELKLPVHGLLAVGQFAVKKMLVSVRLKLG